MIDSYVIKKYDELISTNSFTMEHLAEFNDKDVIIAERQLSGRGRFNRVWVSDGTPNLYMTIVIKPEPNKYAAFPFQNLTQYLALKLCEVLGEFKLSPSLKWPNDVLIKGAKISGILAESYSESSKITASALGIGVNLNLKYETLTKIAQKATSLNMILGREVDVDDFTQKLLDKFFDSYDEFIAKGFFSIKENYEKKCSFIGKKIKVSSLNPDILYVAKRINIDGTLTVLDKNNLEITVIAGDLTY